jgi:hypothetical protein
MLRANVNRLLLLLRMVLDVTLVIDKLTLNRYCAMNQNMKHYKQSSSSSSSGRSLCLWV